MAELGTWVAPALSVHERLVRVPRYERGRIYAEESAARGVSPTTLRRSVVAARYCVQHAKSVGLSVEDVKAATLAIELLMRLERRDRRLANEMRRDVLAGHISVRQLRRHLDNLPERQRHVFELDARGHFELAMIDQCYLETVSGFQTGENSALGKLLKVDIEVYIEGQSAPHAIFISPLDDHSECAGRTIDDQIPFILAATLHYAQVNAILHEQSEGERITSVLQLMPDLSNVRLVGLYLAEED